MTRKGTYRGWAYDVWAIRNAEGQWVPKAQVWRGKEGPRTALEADTSYATRAEAEANAEKAMMKWVEAQK